MHLCADIVLGLGRVEHEIDTCMIGEGVTGERN